MHVVDDFVAIIEITELRRLRLKTRFGGPLKVGRIRIRLKLSLENLTFGTKFHFNFSRFVAELDIAVLGGSGMGVHQQRCDKQSCNAKLL